MPTLGFVSVLLVSVCVDVSNVTLLDKRESERVPVVSDEASVELAGVAAAQAVPFHVATCPVVAEDCVKSDNGCVCETGVLASVRRVSDP